VYPVHTVEKVIAGAADGEIRLRGIPVGRLALHAE